MSAAVEAKYDFFVSYTSVDEPWAKWLAVQLEKAGYTTVLQAFDFRPGQDFVRAMQDAAASAERTIAVLTPAYTDSKFGQSEWGVAFAKDPTGELRLLIPIRVKPGPVPELLRTRIFIDVVGVDEETARSRVLAGVSGDTRRRSS